MFSDRDFRLAKSQAFIGTISHFRLAEIGFGNVRWPQRIVVKIEWNPENFAKIISFGLHIQIRFDHDFRLQNTKYSIGPSHISDFRESGSEM